MKQFYFVFIFLPLFFNANAQVSPSTDTSLYTNNVFQVGEVLKYQISYGLIKGGVATLSTDIYSSGNGDLYHVKAIATTTGLISNFARIYDIYESFFSVNTGFPVKAIRNVRENNYKSYDEVLFSSSQKFIISIKYGQFDIPDATHDVLSAFYFARRYLINNQFKKNESIDLTTYLDGEIYPIKIKFKKTDKLDTDLGEIDCLKFVSVIGGKSPFKSEDDMVIWFSNDGNYVPVKISIDLPISKVKCVLIEYQGLKNPIGIKAESRN